MKTSSLRGGKNILIKSKKTMERYKIKNVWVDDTHVWAETANGWKANYPFSRWKTLANATEKQRENFFLSRYGIHWP